MTTQQNKDLVRRYVENVLNQGDLAEADELVAPDAVMYHAGAPGPIRGLDAIKLFVSAFRASFPDLRSPLEDMVAEGDRVMVRFTWSGTQHGDFQGIPPTGRKFTVTGSGLYRIQDGKIAEVWAEFDTLALLTQLGVMPAASPV